jgi:hypothetical protein
MDDPKKRYPDAPINRRDSDEPAVAQSDFLSAMKALIDSLKTANPADAERTALEAERLMLERERITREMPENKQAPGVSVYSYPEGDLKHPKPDLKCAMFWAGYELTLETLKPTEVDLLNRLEPGEYRVTKTDGTAIPFRVAAKRNDRLQLEELSITFPCKGDQKHNHGSMVSYLQQALGDYIPSQSELMAELQRLKAELAAARVGVGAV